MRRPVLALMALIGAGAAASPGIEGVWSFKTQPFDGDCVMTGQLIVEPGDAAGVHACSIKAHEKCPRIEGDALESCTLNRRTGDVTITSKVIRPPPNAAYYPDDFTLKIESASRMSGHLHSGGGGAPVLFYRGPAIIS